MKLKFPKYQDGGGKPVLSKEEQKKIWREYSRINDMLFDMDEKNPKYKEIREKADALIRPYVNEAGNLDWDVESFDNKPIPTHKRIVSLPNSSGRGYEEFYVITNDDGTTTKVKIGNSPTKRPNSQNKPIPGYKSGGNLSFKKKAILHNDKPIQAEIAESDEELKAGLRGRSEPTPMLLKFPEQGKQKSITMQGVGFPLKLAFIKKGVVTNVVKRKDINSEKLSTYNTDAVLELPIYTKIKKGDVVKYKQGGAWTRKEGQSKTGGLNEKGRRSYERENPGSDLKPPQPEGGSRKKSYCARSAGQMKMFPKAAKDPNSRLRLARKKWKCENGCKFKKGGNLISPEQILSKLKQGGMYLLDHVGNVQTELQGSERIFSRKHTRSLIDKAVTAKSEKELEKLGKMIVDIIDIHNTQKPQYVEE